MINTRHEEFEEVAAVYALDALENGERRQFEEHLRTCAQCQADVAEYRRVAAGLGMAVEAVVPPDALKARTLARATAGSAVPIRPVERRKRAVVPIAWLAAAASLALAVGAGIYAVSLRAQVESLRRMAAESAAQARALRAELSAVRGDSVRLVRIVEVLTSPDLLRVDLAGTTGTSAASGRAFWSRSRGLLFSADRLPPLQAGRTYELWLVLPNKPPIGAGLLTVSAGGSGTLFATLPPDVAMPKAAVVTVAVTNEPTGGSPGPTTPILLAGSAKTE
jgi:anti-sigma-K factor RskA